MIKQPYTFYVERHDPQRNMARYYAMEIVPDLFGQPCLTRRWGRIGKRGQRKQHQFAEEREAVVLFLEIIRKKRKRGYRPPSALQVFNAPSQTADPFREDASGQGLGARPVQAVPPRFNEASRKAVTP